MLSEEEVFFLWYLEELQEAEYVDKFTSKPHSFKLSDKVVLNFVQQGKKSSKTVPKTLLHDHIYTPDFEIVWTKKADRVFTASGGNFLGLKIPFYTDGNYSCIEVKPEFDHKAMQRFFSLNQKWVYNSKGIFVQKIIPNKIFAATFTPKKVVEASKYKKDIPSRGIKAGDSKIKWPVKTLKQFVDGINQK